MRIVLLCATQRGYLFLEKLYQLAQNCEIVVISFRETMHEPPYIDKIKNLSLRNGSVFYETKKVANLFDVFWKKNKVDLMLVVSWRYMIPPHIYRQPILGTYVFHDSLLPAYRGFSPTVWAIINGEHETGVTLFEISDIVDSGDIIDQIPVQIKIKDTIAVVLENVTKCYLVLLEKNLANLLNNTSVKHPQHHHLATYTCKRLPEDNRLDWMANTQVIYNLIRATTFPYSGAYCFLGNRKIYVWEACLLDDVPSYIGRIPGRVVTIKPDEGVVVLTGNGAILLIQIQAEGDSIVSADKLLNRLSYTLR